MCATALLLLAFMTLIMILPSAPGTIGTFEASIILVMMSDLFGFIDPSVRSNPELYKQAYTEAMSFSIILHAYSYITYSVIGGNFQVRIEYYDFQNTSYLRAENSPYLYCSKKRRAIAISHRVQKHVKILSKLNEN